MKPNQLLKTLFLSLLFVVSSCSEQGIVITSKNKAFQLEFNNNGSLKGIYDNTKNKNYLDISEPSYLMAVRINDVFEYPTSMAMKDGRITLSYPSNVQANIKYESKESYCTFELVNMESDKHVDLVTWGLT